MSAETLARALQGRKSGSTWMCRCPAHADRNPSLALREAEGGGVLVYCHAGCAQEQVIAALRARDLWPGGSGPMPGPVPYRPDRTLEEEAERTAAALRIWEQTLPAPGTVGEAYLRRRGITLEPPPVLRFHPGLKHPSGGYWPGIVALVTDGVTGRPRAIHRTFLACDGRGKAPVDPNRLMLGPCGGGVVRLAEAGTEVLVGEGLETCLAGMQASGRPAWSALSASGLRRLDLPDFVTSVTVLADGDPPGAAAARQAATRWRREGRQVRIAWPPPGQDFADLLMGEGTAA